jgi:predicted molibdopterin-dependent oxidoreductase YjgC
VQKGDLEVDRGDLKVRKVLTTCGYCGCGCNFYLNVHNDEVVGVTPKLNHPVSKGKLCIKGWQGFSFVRHQDRLKKPLIKNAAGKFEEVTWEKAYDYIVKGLQGIKEKYGSESIGVLSSARCTNEENYLLTKFARAVLGTNNVDHCARL